MVDEAVSATAFAHHRRQQVTGESEFRSSVAVHRYEPLNWEPDRFGVGYRPHAQ